MRRVSIVAAVLGIVAACGGDRSNVPADPNLVEVVGVWRGVDADRFAEVLAPLEAQIDVDVRYVGSVDFVDDLASRLKAGREPPNIAMVPQPALVRDLAAGGHIVPLAPHVSDVVVENLGPDVAALGAVDGVLYGVPYRVTVKSLVWYRPEVFAARGWEIPVTLDELADLVDRIAADGDLAPWCLGIEAGTATGWTATDWTEDLVLRAIGPDRYQQWAIGEIDFADPEIADAFARFRALALEPGQSLGGARAIIDTPVEEAFETLLADPPRCAMHRQADFAENWLPDGTTIGPDGAVDVFVFPGADEGPPPLVVGGNQAVQFVADADTDAAMAYLASPQAATIWARRGGFFSPNRRVSDDVYPDDYLRELRAAVDEAPAIVFDASDQMSPSIGADLLWDRIAAWVAGVDDYATFAAVIDEARATRDSRAGRDS